MTEHRRIDADPLSRHAAICCFLVCEVKNLKHLVLISVSLIWVDARGSSARRRSRIL